jgi:hypothetical protein
MRAMAELAGAKLKWQQRGTAKFDYELFVEGEPSAAAILSFRRTLGSLATAECADGCWTFKRVGMLQPRVTARRCGSDTNIAVFRRYGGVVAAS